MWPWSELGLESTDDVRAIKKAYARLLKQTRPDEHPEAFQRLHQAGWPHARVSSLYIAATGVLAIALVWGGLPWVITLAVLELLLGIWLDQQVAVPFVVASRS